MPFSRLVEGTGIRGQVGKLDASGPTTTCVTFLCDCYEARTCYRNVFALIRCAISIFVWAWVCWCTFICVVQSLPRRVCSLSVVYVHFYCCFFYSFFYLFFCYLLAINSFRLIWCRYSIVCVDLRSCPCLSDPSRLCTLSVVYVRYHCTVQFGVRTFSMCFGFFYQLAVFSRFISHLKRDL